MDSEAADQGLARAQFNLGLMYSDGEGVPKDPIRAYSWWNLAAAQGHEGAKKNKKSIGDRMTPPQIAEAEKISSEFKPVKSPNTGF